MYYLYVTFFINDQSALSSLPTLRKRYINPSYYYYYIDVYTHTHTHTYIYIYIRVCEYVEVCLRIVFSHLLYSTLWFCLTLEELMARSLPLILPSHLSTYISNHLQSSVHDRHTTISNRETCHSNFIAE